MTSEPFGVTVISPSYAKIGNEAVKRFKKFTGARVHVVRCKDKDGFETKLNLDKIVGEGPFVFFDADWWLLRELDISTLCGGYGWSGVQDPMVHHPHCIPFKDCRDHGLQTHKYINTGLFGCDTRLRDHRWVFQEARRTWKRGIKTHDHTDQYHLNRAILRSGLPQKMLPFGYNYFTFAVNLGGFPYIPRIIVGLHAAGSQKHRKMATLKREAAVFGYTAKPMLPGAVDHHHALNFEYR